MLASLMLRFRIDVTLILVICMIYPLADLLIHVLPQEQVFDAARGFKDPAVRFIIIALVSALLATGSVVVVLWKRIGKVLDEKSDMQTTHADSIKEMTAEVTAAVVAQTSVLQEMRDQTRDLHSRIERLVEGNVK